MFESLKAAFRLARPVNVSIAMLSVLIAAMVTGTLEPHFAVLLAAISAGLIMTAGNTINDYFDIEIDRINKPLRPLPAQKISSETARRLAFGEFFLGITLSAFISLPMLLIAAFFSLLIYLYAAILKRTVLWGNVVVSLATAATFIYGGMAVRRPGAAIIPALFAFFFHFGREILKDIEDIDGDQQNAAQTFPIRFGVRPAIRLIWLNFLLLTVLTAVPFMAGWYGAVYFSIVVFGVYPVIGYVLISILQNTAPKHLNFLSNLLKADMLIGLLAIYFR